MMQLFTSHTVLITSHTVSSLFLPVTLYYLSQSRAGFQGDSFNSSFWYVLRTVIILYQRTAVSFTPFDTVFNLPLPYITNY